MKKTRKKIVSVVFVKLFSDYSSSVIIKIVLGPNVEWSGEVKRVLLEQKNSLNLPYNICSLKQLCKKIPKAAGDTETTLSFYADQILFSLKESETNNSISFEAYGKKLYRFFNPKKIDSLNSIIENICPTYSLKYDFLFIDPDCDYIPTIDQDDKMYNKSYDYLK